MLDAETALGLEGQSRHADGNRNFLVARNGGRANNAKSMALSVNDGAAIVLKLRECRKNKQKVVSGTSYFLVTNTNRFCYAIKNVHFLKKNNKTNVRRLEIIIQTTIRTATKENVRLTT